MTRYNTIKNNFTKGELDPNFIGRIEIEDYGAGCALLENMIPLPQGGATKRPGTFVVEEITNIATASIGTSTFRDFEIYSFSMASSSNSGISELRSKTVNICISLKAYGSDNAWIKFYESSGEQITTTSPYYIRPIKNVGDGVSPTANETFIATDRELETLDFSFVQQNNFVFFTHKSGKMSPFFVCLTPANTMVYSPVGYYFPTLRSDLYPYFPLAVPKGDLFNANLVPYTNVNVGTTTFTPSAVSGNITITSSDNFFYDLSSGAYDLWQGTIIAITNGSTTGFARVTSWVSNTVVNAEVLINFGAASASTAWRVSCWNGYYGFPRSVTIHDQRLVWGGNRAFPSTFWVSEKGDIFHMRNFKAAQDASTNSSGLGYFGAATESDAFDAILAANYRNEIRFLVSFRNLLIGTDNGLIAIRPIEGVFAYNTIYQSLEDDTGCGYANPLVVNNNVFYTDATNQRLVFLELNENSGAYSTKDATALNYNIISAFHEDQDYSGLGSLSKRDCFIKNMVYFDQYKTIMMTIGRIGSVIGFSYNPSAGVTAFSRHRLAPYGKARVTHIAVGPSITWVHQSDAINCLYLAVERTNHDGTQKSYTLEQLSTPLQHDTKLYVSGATNYFVNNGYQQTFGAFKPSINYMDGMNTTTNHASVLGVPSNVTFLARRKSTSRIYDSSTLEVMGKSVATSGALYYWGQLASSGSGVVTTPSVHGLTTAAATALINPEIFYGFSYPSKIKLLPVEAGANFGVRQGSIQRTHEIVLRLRDSRGFKAGKDFTSMVDYLSKYFPTAAPTYDILTGDFRVHFVGNPDNDQLCIQHDIPFPFTVIAVVLKGVSYD